MTDDRAMEMEDQPAGCGVQGCLTAAVALFIILLVALAFIAIIRFSSPPQPSYGAAGPPDLDPSVHRPLS